MIEFEMLKPFCHAYSFQPYLSVSVYKALEEPSQSSKLNSSTFLKLVFEISSQVPSGECLQSSREPSQL